jgi:hypothetical protein
VTAEIAISAGNRFSSMSGRSMRTEVSINPRGERGSASRRGILIDHAVDILPKTRAGDARRSGEGGDYRVGRHEHALTERAQLANRNPIPGDDERSSLVEVTHDSPAVVAELALGNASSQPIVARALRRRPNVSVAARTAFYGLLRVSWLAVALAWVVRYLVASLGE